MIRVLVCGGRDFGDISWTQINLEKMSSEERKKREDEYNFIQAWLFCYCVDNCENPINLKEIEIITGVARGADLAAYHFAVTHNIKYHAYPAHWNSYGMSAGPIRNKQMLDEGKPDVVIAFPGGRGTAHMVNIAKKAGVKVIEVKYDNT